MTRTPSPQTTEGLGATPLTAEEELRLREMHPNGATAMGRTLLALAAARLSVPSEALAEARRQIETLPTSRTVPVLGREGDIIGERSKRIVAADFKRTVLRILAALPNREDAPEPPARPADRLADVGFDRSGGDLATVLSAVDHLLRDHDCDLMGYEEVMGARDRLRAVREDAPREPRKLCPHCDGRGTVGAEDTDPAILAAAPRYDGHEFYEDARLPREPGLCDYTMPDGDWCGRPLSFHWHNREAAQRERLREAIGTSGEDSGLEHWHYARGGRMSPDERAGVFVDRQQVLDAIDRVLG